MSNTIGITAYYMADLIPETDPNGKKYHWKVCNWREVFPGDSIIGFLGKYGYDHLDTPIQVTADGLKEWWDIQAAPIQIYNPQYPKPNVYKKDYWDYLPVVNFDNIVV